MNFEDLATKFDLTEMEKRIFTRLKDILNGKSDAKEFYSPKEFGKITGLKYSTIAYKCLVGKLKARQDAPGCSWQIYASEIERLKDEAIQNF